MSTKRVTPPRILIVEDESVVAMDLETNLERLGYVVLGSATTGEDALEFLESHAPDLILMDIQLGGTIDGLTVAERVGEQYRIPVVFLTANVNADTIARAKQSGSFGFLNKPFRPKELNATIEIALHQHHAGQRLFAEKGWLRTMLGSISDGVIGTDTHGNVQFLNAAATEMTGWSMPEALGTPITEVFPLVPLSGHSERTAQPADTSRQHAPTPKQRFFLQARHGGRRAVESASSPIYEAGQVQGVVTTFVDIEERLQREQQSERERERLSEQVQITSQALGQTREQLQALSHHLMAAQEQERRRIARELHDDLGQQAAYLGMQIDALKTQLPFQSEALASVRSGVDKLNQGLREVSHQLHPSILEDLGLGEALHSLATSFRSQGLPVKATLAHHEMLPLEVSSALYRIAQESLRNVQKHAAASSVRLILSSTAKEVHLRIADNGQGFSLGDVIRGGGLGLVSMQERARHVGGNLLLTAEPDKGTTVLVRVPL